MELCWNWHAWMLKIPKNQTFTQKSDFFQSTFELKVWIETFAENSDQSGRPHSWGWVQKLRWHSGIIFYWGGGQELGIGHWQWGLGIIPLKIYQLKYIIPMCFICFWGPFSSILLIMQIYAYLIPVIELKNSFSNIRIFGINATWDT